MRIHVDRDFAGSVAELIESSAIVAIGVLGSQGSEVSRSSDGSILHLAQEFQVERFLVGSAATAQIGVLRSVRAEDGVPVVEFDATPLQAGARYVLFLRSEPDVYVTVGGPQGQFRVDDKNVVHALSTTMPASHDIDGMTLEALTDLVGSHRNR